MNTVEIEYNGSHTGGILMGEKTFYPGTRQIVTVDDEEYKIICNANKAGWVRIIFDFGSVESLEEEMKAAPIEVEFEEVVEAPVEEALVEEAPAEEAPKPKRGRRKKTETATEE